MSQLVDSLLTSHPYYPTSLKLPGYASPNIPFGTVLAIFFSGSALLFLACWLVSGKSNVTNLLTL